MRKALFVAIIGLGLMTFRVGLVGDAQEDPFLALYYNDNGAVLCRDYMTANGARFATYQWWLLGFVSGAAHVRSTMRLAMAKTDVAEALEWASNYCQGHPQDTLGAVGVALVAKLELGAPAR